MVEKLLTKDYRKRPDIEQILRLESVAEKMRLYGLEVPSLESLKNIVSRGGLAKR